MALAQNIFRTTILIQIVAILTSCNMFKKEDTQPPTYTFYAGTYTKGESEGIYKFSMNDEGIITTAGLAYNTENPAFMALSPDRRFLIAVNEVKNADGTGTIGSYRIENDKLTLVNLQPTGGAHPCFVDVNGHGQVVVANYSGGNIGLLRVDEHGELSPLLSQQQHEGKGTTDRQKAPHAHSVWFERDGQKIIAADLGTNQLWFWKTDTSLNKLTARHPVKLDLETGAGPRHLAFHPNNKWIYVLNELNNTITLIKKDNEGNYEIAGAVSTLPNDFSDYNLSAHIVITSDGKYVYSSNRGHNSIGIFETNPQDGSLKFNGYHKLSGDWPRHFALTPDENFLVVANQNSGNILSLRRDKTFGTLSPTGESALDSVVCILFY